MTTWTCKGLVAGLGLMMILAGCTEDGGLALDVPASGGQAAVTSTVLGDGRVETSQFILGPEGSGSPPHYHMDAFNVATSAARPAASFATKFVTVVLL